MKSLQPETPVANICDGGGSVTAARERLTDAGAAPVERAAKVGLTADIAALYRDDPPRPGRRSATWSPAWPVRS